MVALFSYDECKHKAALATACAQKARDASTAEEYRQIAALWEALCAAMEKNGVSSLAASAAEN